MDLKFSSYFVTFQPDTIWNGTPLCGLRPAERATIFINDHLIIRRVGIVSLFTATSFGNRSPSIALEALEGFLPISWDGERAERIAARNGHSS